MTIRKKIFLLAGIILTLFGVVVGALAVIQELDRSQIENIIGYELPLSRLVAEFDVLTDRYELVITRVLRSGPVGEDEMRAANDTTRAIRQQLKQDAGEATALLDRVIRDPGYATADRVELARIGGSLRYLSRNLDEFLAVGETTMAAIGEGRADDARAASRGFAKFSQTFGPDLSEIRRAIAGLTERSAQAVIARGEFDSYLAIGLFLVACGIGVGISAIGSTRVVSGLRKLVASTKAIETGSDLAPVVISTRDEVGELAKSFNRMAEELRKRERIKDTFGKFVDPRVVNQLIATGADQAERRRLTVLFSDIKGFAGISEELTAGAVVNLLNFYFGSVSQVIHTHRGVIDKYIGDAVMAFWTPPFSPGDDHASDACLAALSQQEVIAGLRAKLPEITGIRRNPPTLAVRMGIATGEALVGTIGSTTARSFTAIGDTVNLASRLEGINKVYGTSIVLSEETNRSAQNAIETRELDFITVAGKMEPVRIYELMARSGELTPERSELRDLFSKGIATYRNRDWDDAHAQFEHCLRLAPDDGPAQLYLKRVAALRCAPPPADWNGIWRYEEKTSLT
jgi:adenylate cyclase